VYTDLGIWSAQRAGIATDRIVNWLPIDRLRKEVLNKNG
jgi:hypothetical protein